MRTVRLPSGRTMPALGQGTWNMGEDRQARGAEVAALQLGLDLGMNLIDTAEMYGEGGAEEVVGAAIAGRRDAVFLVSKVYPHNASRAGVRAACERSLRRLGTDRLDLYLLHWRGDMPLAETLAGLLALQLEGKILEFGVSNFDRDDMLEAAGLPGGAAIATNQVLYNLPKRGVEWDLLPWMHQQHMPLMAYSPLDSSPAETSSLLRNATLVSVAARHGITPGQLAVAWLLHRPNVAVIPKAVQLEHVEQNRAALNVLLSGADLSELDAAFPPPRRATPLAMR
ncbi:aldo/keto reductase [Massilia sp. S19_KUP03_FR1]|uniref:aldo/keto reductase n=1 Tax=Massilia sp. S19_KUP03_FR1 TaxID=3025503 RepID=UPI002FCD8DB7